MISTSALRLIRCYGDLACRCHHVFRNLKFCNLQRILLLNVLSRRNQALTLALPPFSRDSIAEHRIHAQSPPPWLSTSTSPDPRIRDTNPPAHRPGFGQSQQPRSAPRSPSSLLTATPNLITRPCSSPPRSCRTEKSISTSAQPSLAGSPQMGRSRGKGSVT
jgi:hypothetical protein